MAAGQDSPTRVAADLPAWIGDVVEHSDSYRFEALTLLGEAESRLRDLAANPPADSAVAAAAALPPMHLALKALLAAKAARSYSTRASLELLPILYAEEAPATDAFVSVQSLKLQGAKAIAAARSFVGAASKLLAGQT